MDIKKDGINALRKELENNNNPSGPGKQQEALYTHFRIDFKDWPEDFDYTICETITEVGKIMRFAEVHFDDDTRKTEAIVTGIALTKKEYRKWKKDHLLPERFGESYAASRQQGYSLEQIEAVIEKYNHWSSLNTINQAKYGGKTTLDELVATAKEKFSFKRWLTTPEGKALLGERSQPVGVQDWKTIEVDILDILFESNGTGSGTDLVVEYFKKLLGESAASRQQGDEK